jgi:small conductance mechanosensitive channel
MPPWLTAALPEIIAMLKTLSMALLMFFGGRWLIEKVVALIRITLEKRKFDPTLGRYVISLASIALNVFLIIGILSIFGIETTSFAALIAAMGLAIGAAWSGMLSNFAAGVFLIMFKPFKVGDFIAAGGVTGTVKEIGMFATTICTLENVFTVVGNGKIAGDNISNYSHYPNRAVDLRAQIAHGVDPLMAIAALRGPVEAVSNLAADHKPLIDVLEFNERGTLLVVRPFCHNDHYWQVHFDTNRAIAATLSGKNFPVPASYSVEYEYEYQME